MHATPDIAPSAEWLDAWDGHELQQLSLGRGPSTIRNRKCFVMIMAKHFTADGITDFGLSPQSGGIRPETARSTANALAKAANRQGHHGVPVVNLDTSHIITETAWGATCSCGKQFGAPTDSYHQGALNFTLANAYRHADSANRKERDR